MRDKSSQYVRTTITVPKDLKQRMLRVRTVNWSGVACQAFEATISGLLESGETAMSDMPPMDDAIERLRRLKKFPESTESPREFESGFHFGRRWAMATATPQELGRLDAFFGQGQHILEGFDGKELMRRIARIILGSSIEDRKTPRVLREFWPAKVGLAERPGDYLAFAKGFCEGAMGFWKEVKDKI